MIEIQISGKKKSAAAGSLFYTDFEKQQVGDKNIVDWSPNNLQMALQGNTTSNFGVVDHPTIGRCFQFNGTGFLGVMAAGMGALSNFSLSPFLLEIGFIKPQKNLESVMGTGNYATTSSSGFNILLDQDADSFQLFLMRSQSDYQRLYIPGAQDLGYNEYTIERNATTTIAKNLTKNTTANRANFNSTFDSYFSVGGSMDAKTSNILTGYIKYVRIQKK